MGKGASRAGSVANRPALTLLQGWERETGLLWGSALGSIFKRVIDTVLEVTGGQNVGGGGGRQNWTLLEKLGGSEDLREAGVCH